MYIALDDEWFTYVSVWTLIVCNVFGIAFVMFSALLKWNPSSLIWVKDLWLFLLTNIPQWVETYPQMNTQIHGFQVNGSIHFKMGFLCCVKLSGQCFSSLLWAKIQWMPCQWNSIHKPWVWDLGDEFPKIRWFTLWKKKQNIIAMENHHV